MTNGQKNFYRILHILSIIGIIGLILGMIALLFIWILKPIGEGTFYKINSGILSFTLSQEMVGEDFFFSNIFFLSLIVALLIIIVLLVNVKKFFKNLINNNVFVVSNADNIRNVGWIVIILSLLKNVPTIFLANDISKSIGFSDVPFSINYGIEYEILFAGLAILAVSQVFKRAIVIAEENKFTI